MYCTLNFPTMGRADDAHGGAARLVALKAVGEGYPLRGKLRTTSTPGTADEATISAFADAILTLDDSMPTGTYVDMCSKLPLVDPTQVKSATLIMRGEFEWGEQWYVNAWMLSGFALFIIVGLLLLIWSPRRWTTTRCTNCRGWTIATRPRCRTGSWRTARWR